MKDGILRLFLNASEMVDFRAAQVAGLFYDDPALLIGHRIQVVDAEPCPEPPERAAERLGYPGAVLGSRRAAAHTVPRPGRQPHRKRK